MLCGELFAQGTIHNGEAVSQRAASLIPGSQIVHGVGVHPLSSYFPDSSYQDAFERSLEDLRSNLMTSVYLESFQTTRLTQQNEFAILDSLNPELVVKVDSTVHRGYVYYFSSIKGQVAHQVPAISPDAWTSPRFTPIQHGEYWLASGHHEFSKYVPYESWARSKMNALSRLSNILGTEVQSSIRTYNSSSQRATYISSKAIFKHILVIDRRMEGDICHTLIAVHQDNISFWE